MATKKKASKTTVTDVAVREGKGVGTDLVPYNRGKIARGSLQPYQPENLKPDPNAPAAPELVESWNAITPDFPPTFYFREVGDFLIGVFDGTKTVQANGKDTTLYLLKVGQGAEEEQIAIWDCISLSRKMGKVKMGQRVSVQLIGMRPSNNYSNPWYDFDVRTPKN